MKRTNLIIIILITIILLFQIILFISFKGSTTDNSKVYLDIASRLKGTGLGLAAAKFYENVLEGSRISDKERSNIHYNIAKIYFENGKHEDALGHLYSAELLYPKSELKNEIGELIMNSLERLGRKSAAEYALESRSGMKKDDVGDKIVAEIGEQKITLNEFSEYLDRVPEWMRNEKFKTKEGKEEFLKKYVAEILLYRKAEKEGLSKEEPVQKRLKDLERELLIQTILEREIKSKVDIDEETIKLYFKANKDKYKEKNKEVDFESVKERVKKDLFTEKMQGALSEMINQMITTSGVRLYPETIK